MKLSEFFQGLSYGELSNLSIGSEGAGSIEAGKEAKIVRYVNEGLLRLHSRFLLIERDMIIEQQEAQTLYKLDRRFAVSNQENPDELRFINDQGDPFLNDVIKILAVNDALGCGFPLNDPENPQSLFTPMPDTLQVPHPLQGVPLEILYQARHPVLTETDLDAEIDLPPILEPALSKYVAHLTYSHMNGQENSAKSVEYATVFENICAEIERNDLMSSSYSATNTRFNKGGWA